MLNQLREQLDRRCPTNPFVSRVRTIVEMLE
jgi:hypothetical protein